MAKKSKKSASTKLPKTLAGVKVPGSVRRAGASLAGLINSDAGRAALGAALVAAGEALIRHRVGAEAGKKAATTLGTVAGAAAEVVGDAARQVLPASLTGEAEPDRPREAPNAASPAFTAADEDEVPRRRRAKH